MSEKETRKEGREESKCKKEVMLAGGYRKGKGIISYKLSHFPSLPLDGRGLHNVLSTLNRYRR